MTAFLLAGQIGRIQAVLTASLPDTAQVQRLARTDDNEGGSSETWANQGSTVACRVEPFFGRRGGIEQIDLGRIEETALWRLVLPAATDVTAKDRITVGARTFDVVAVAAPESWEVERLAFCTERL